MFSSISSLTIFFVLVVVLFCAEIIKAIKFICCKIYSLIVEHTPSDSKLTGTADVNTSCTCVTPAGPPVSDTTSCPETLSTWEMSTPIPSNTFYFSATLPMSEDVICTILTIVSTESAIETIKSSSNLSKLVTSLNSSVNVKKSVKKSTKK